MRLRASAVAPAVRVWPHPCLEHLPIFGMSFDTAVRIAEACGLCRTPEQWRVRS